MNKLGVLFFILFLFSCQEPTAEQQLSSVVEVLERQSSKKRSGRGGGSGGRSGKSYGSSSADNSADARLAVQFMEISRLMSEGDYEAAAALSKNTDSRELSRLLGAGNYEAAADLLQNALDALRWKYLDSSSQ